MATRSKKPRRPVKKKSNIADAQRKAVERRLERDTLLQQGKAQKLALAEAKAKEKKTPEMSGNDRPGTVAHATGDGTLKTTLGQYERPTTPGAASTDKPATSGAARPLADPSLYAKTEAARVESLARLRSASDYAKAQALAKDDQAVYMGPGTAKLPVRGPGRMEGEGGKNAVTTVAVGDDIQRSDDLIGWLADPVKVAEIKAKANAAGLNVQTYEDVAKLWESIVKQAAVTFSRTSKKVTPWALMELRGKYAGPDGNMQDKVTTSTTIDEMDGATARGMFEKTAQDMLGRAPTKAEIDDFIAKAQTIARQNPAITTTRTKVGFDGQVETGTSQTTTKGGGQVVADKAQLAGNDMAMQDEEYGAYQAAGNYFPMLFDALRSPV